MVIKMNYQEAVEYIEEIRKKLASDYSMERVMKLAELMGHPEKKLRVVHIAGTNGCLLYTSDAADD